MLKRNFLKNVKNHLLLFIISSLIKLFKLCEEKRVYINQN